MVCGRCSLYVAYMLPAQFNMLLPALIAEGGSKPLGSLFAGSLSEGGEASEAHYWWGRFLKGERAHRPTICRVAF